MINNILFLDYNLLNNKTHHNRVLDISNTYQCVVLLSNDQITEINGYALGLNKLILAILPKNFDDIHRFLDKHLHGETFYADTRYKLTWDTLELYNQTTNSYRKHPYRYAHIGILSDLKLPEYAEEWRVTI